MSTPTVSSSSYTHYINNHQYPVIIYSKQLYINQLIDLDISNINTASAYIKQYPPDIYTTIKLRFIGHSYHYTYKAYHICRLINSYDYNNSSIHELSDYIYINQQLDLVLQQFNRVVQQKLIDIPDNTHHDLMCCILLYNHKSIEYGTKLNVYIKPTHDVTAIQSVAIMGEPRTNPYSKHTQWLYDRSILDYIKQSLNVYDLILHRNHYLYESLIHNLFIIKRTTANKYGYALHTISNNILYGISRHNIIELCAELDITVEYTTSHINQCNTWCGIILCNSLHPIVLCNTVYHWFHVIQPGLNSTIWNDYTIDTAVRYQIDIQSDTINFCEFLQDKLLQRELKSIEL